MIDNKYLDLKEAVRLMLDGEVLMDKYGNDNYWKESDGTFAWKNPNVDRDRDDRILSEFHSLCRKPQKQKRLMTRWEILAWATSDDAKGWVVGIKTSDTWDCPQNWCYSGNISDYSRARLLPDDTGIDESTITDFSVEVDDD